MNFFKKALIAILSVGLVTVPATREVETVEAVDHTGGYVYFLKPSTWTSSKVMMFIGHNSYTSVYEMTKVSNTNNLYCYTMPSWGGATYVAFANASSLWGCGSWGPSNRTNATHYTNVYNNYGFNSGSYYIVVPASDSNNAGISINYKGTSANTINLTTRAEVYCDKVSNAAAGTVSVSGYYMSAYNTASTRSAVSSTSSVAYASTTANAELGRTLGDWIAIVAEILSVLCLVVFALYMGRFFSIKTDKEKENDSKVAPGVKNGMMTALIGMAFCQAAIIVAQLCF